MLSRQRRAEVVVVRNRFIDKAIDASFQDVRLSDGGCTNNLRTLTGSLYQGVFSSQELDGLVSTLTNGAEEHPLLKQIAVIRSLAGIDTINDISSLFNPDRENELNSLIASATKNVIRCEKAADKENTKNQKLAEKRTKNPQLVSKAKDVVEKYRNTLRYSHGDIPGDPPTQAQTEAYEKAYVFLCGHNTQQEALRAAINELKQYEGQIITLQQQKNWLDALKNIIPIRKAAKDFVKKYPTARELVTVEQFLFCLMADVLVTLNKLRESYEDSLLSRAEVRLFINQDIVKNIKQQIEHLTASGYLPKAPEVHDLFKIQSEADLLTFLGQIAKHDRLQYTSPTAGIVRVNSQLTIADDSAENDSMAVFAGNSSQPPSVTETVIPATPYFPVYLAKSFMLHLANALKTHVSGMKGSDENAENKKGLMEAAEKWLRKRDPQAELAMTSFKDIYDAKPTLDEELSNQTIAEILNIRRDLSNTTGKPSGAFAKTLTQAGKAFLEENPASLMRRHAFLEWMQETCTFPKEVDLNIAKGHLIEVVAQIKALRAVMKSLYPTSAEPVKAHTILRCVSQLVAFGKANEEKNAQIAILVRVLLLAGVDKLDSANFAQLKAADKSWLLNSEKIITDKQGYLKAVAKNITATPKVIEYGIGCWVTALLEITSFQQARYDSLFNHQPYMHQEHQKKIESTVLHLSQCVENYFEESALKPEKMPKFAQVAKVFSTTPQRKDDTIELTVRSCESGDRLRLPVNLQSDIQAMLTWGVTGDNPVHLRTLALLNSDNVDGLSQWEDELASSGSPAAWINAAMLQQGSDYAENIFSQLGALNLLAKRIKYYTALVALAETLLQHLKGVQSEPEMPENQPLAQFYKAVYENINRLMEVIVQEKNDAPSDVQEELEALEGRVQVFSDGLIAACYSLTGANIDCIKGMVFGEKIIDPKNPAFDAAFDNISNPDATFTEENDQYFIDVMFTLAHHPMAEIETNKPKSLCGKIVDSVEKLNVDSVRNAWWSLYEKFYGNSEGLQQLINYYYPPQNLGEVAIKKALKIAIFGFAYPDFQAGKLMFAQQILRAFAALAQLNYDEENAAQRLMNECHDSIAYLKQAFALLATTPGLRFELGGFIGALKARAEEIGDDTENHFHSLDIEAKKQHVVYATDENSMDRHDKITKGKLLGLAIGAQRYVEQAARHRNAVLSLRLPQPVKAAAPEARRTMDELLTPYVGDQRTLAQIAVDFDEILTGLLDGAFPKKHPETSERLRYFKTGSMREEAQLDKKDHDNRSELKAMFWQKICEVKEKTSRIKIDSYVLNTAINRLYLAVDAKIVPNDSALKSNRTLQMITSTVLGSAAERTDIKLVTSTDSVFFGNRTLAAIGQKLYARLNGLIAEAQQAAALQSEHSGHNLDGLTNDDNDVDQASSEVNEPLISRAVASSDTLNAGRDSDEVLEISEEAVTNAVIAAIEWLEGTPTVDNIPAEVSLVIDTTSLSQEHIDKFKSQLASIQVDWFAYRVKLIRTGKSDRALEHVNAHRRQRTTVEDGQESKISHDTLGPLPFPEELDAFIGKLKDKITGKQSSEYQRYLNDFVWAVAETVVFQLKNKQSLFIDSAISQPIAAVDLLQPVIDRGFDAVACIALGCEQYAMMSEDARIQKGSRLLEALLYIVSQSGLFTDERQSLLPEACRSLIEKLQAALKKRNDGVQPQHDDGTAIYYLIYTLAQAMSYEEDSVIKTRYESRETAGVTDSGMENVDYTDDNQGIGGDDKNIAVDVEHPETLNNSVARQLLDRLNALLFSNPTFSEWHRRIVKIGSEYETSLHVLTFHKEYSVAQMGGLLAEPSHSDKDAVMSRISKMDYFWEEYYAKSQNFRKQFAYEALAIDELVRILNADTITEVKFKNFYAKDGMYATQHNTILEQLALVFLAVKRWYKPKQHQTAAQGVQEDARTPFIPALSLLASGFAGSGKENASFEFMMQSLLEKACDSFNAMLQSKKQEESASQTAEYVLLTKEVIQWVKDTPEILDVYVARTLETGVHCKEQAELIFQLLSQASDAPTMEPTIPQDSQSARRASTVGLELGPLSSSLISLFSKTGNNPEYQALRSEDDEHQPDTRESVIIEAPSLQKPRPDDELQLLSNAFECMYQYIDQGIPKKTRVKLSSGTVETRLREFLAQVEKHNLWQDYWAYVAELAQSGTPENYDVGNHLSKKGKPYLKLYTNLLWNCWVANPGKKEEQKEAQKEVWLKVVMGHLFGNYVAIEDTKGAILIVNWMIEQKDAKTQHAALDLTAPALTALAERIVKSQLNKPLGYCSKEDRALEVIKFVRNKIEPVLLNVTQSPEHREKFIYHGLLMPLKNFFACEEKEFCHTVRYALRAFCGKLGITAKSPADSSDDAARLRGSSSSRVSFNGEQEAHEEEKRGSVDGSPSGLLEDQDNAQNRSSSSSTILRDGTLFGSGSAGSSNEEEEKIDDDQNILLGRRLDS